MIKRTQTFSVGMSLLQSSPAHSNITQSHSRNRIRSRTADLIVCSCTTCIVPLLADSISRVRVSSRNSAHPAAQQPIGIFAWSWFIIIIMIIIYRTIFNFWFASFLRSVLEWRANRTREMKNWLFRTGWRSACLFIAQSIFSSTYFAGLFVRALFRTPLTLPPFLSQKFLLCVSNAERERSERVRQWEREGAKCVITLDVRVSVCARILLINRFRCNVYSSRLRSVVDDNILLRIVFQRLCRLCCYISQRVLFFLRLFRFIKCWRRLSTGNFKYERKT